MATIVCYLTGIFSSVKKYSHALTVSICAIYFAVNKMSIAAGLSSLFIGMMLTKVFRGKGKSKNWAILPLLIGFLMSAFVSGSEVRSILQVNSEPKSYVRDMGLYLKTYYLMKTDTSNYYKAHAKALLNHAEFHETTLPKDVWSWRLPTIFLMWSILPFENGEVVYALYVILAIVVLIASASIGKYYWHDGYSFLLLPYLFFTYLRFPLHDWTILQVEWWAALFWVLGAWGLIKKRYFVMFVGAILSVLIRELMIVPLALSSLVSLLYKKRHETLITIVIGISFMAFMIWHSNQIGIVAGTLNEQGFNPRLNGSALVVQATLAFGSWEFLLNQYRIFTVLWIFAFFGYFLRPTFYKLFLATPMALTIFYLRFATGVWSHVWGVLFMPSVLIGSFILFSQMKSLSLVYAKFKR